MKIDATINAWNPITAALYIHHTQQFLAQALHHFPQSFFSKLSPFLQAPKCHQLSLDYNLPSHVAFLNLPKCPLYSQYVKYSLL